MPDISYTTVAELRGETEKIVIVFYNFPARVNKKNQLAFVDMEFGEWLAETIYSKHILFATKVGLFKKKMVCQGCKSVILVDQPQPGKQAFSLTYKTYAPIQVEAVFPSVICPGCGKTIGYDPDGSLAISFSDAMINAFDAGQIKPG